MDIGKMNQRVTIQRNTEIQDENGFDKVDWVDLKTVWCSVNNLYGKEYWEAKRYDAENTVEFVIRHGACKDLRMDDRLVFRGVIYNITSIDNVMYGNNVIKIKAEGMRV